MSASLLDLRFVLLLCGIGLCRALCPRRAYPLFGALASAGLLAYAAPSTLIVIGGITLLFLFPVHRILVNMRERGSSDQARKRILVASIIVLVLLLVIFKVYRNLPIPFLDNTLLQKEIVSLIGFSYFLFRTIGFLHIQYILPINERAPWTLLFYTLFPPTLTSGPIQKFQDFREQVQKPEPFSNALIWSAVYRVTRGYFRKVVLAVLFNRLGDYLLSVSRPSAPVSVLAIAAMYLFFYFDFAGYSDIAIGFGLLLGIRVPENFRKPFLATTVSEFWRNWHITLADWFRDQVFIPMGGMKGSRLWAASLAFLIMVFCGFWHGLTVSFLAWGLWHGMVLFTEAISGAKPVPPAYRSGIKYWSRVLWTNSRVAFGAIFFLPWETTVRLLGGLARWHF